MSALVPPSNARSRVFLLSDGEVGTIVDRGLHHTETSTQDVFYNTIYSLVSLTDGVDTLTIFTVASY